VKQNKVLRVKDRKQAIESEKKRKVGKQIEMRGGGRRGSKRKEEGVRGCKRVEVGGRLGGRENNIRAMLVCIRCYLWLPWGCY
jgi:hypothetical protein